MSITTIRSLAIASIGLIAFVVILVIAKIYTDSEVPIQFAGALLGAIVTAVITMALLHGQSQAEETKERNVKVFEEKTRRYNEFLASLWGIWEDRKVSLEELSALMEKFSRDIVIFTKEANSQRIIHSLTKIANHAGNKVPGEKEQQAVQAEVFAIINVIAEELNLGGRINDKIQEDLNTLEGKIRPFLEDKELRAKLLSDVNEVFAAAELNLSFNDAYYDDWGGDTYLCIRIDHSRIELIAGPVVDRTGSGRKLLGLFVEYYSARNYQSFRDAVKGFRKDFLRGIWWGFEMVNFASDESTAAWKHKVAHADGDGPGQVAARQMLEFVTNWRFDGRDLASVLDECEPNRSPSR